MMFCTDHELRVARFILRRMDPARIRRDNDHVVVSSARFQNGLCFRNSSIIWLHFTGLHFPIHKPNKNVFTAVSIHKVFVSRAVVTAVEEMPAGDLCCTSRDQCFFCGRSRRRSNEGSSILGCWSFWCVRCFVVLPGRKALFSPSFVGLWLCSPSMTMHQQRAVLCTTRHNKSANSQRGPNASFVA